jgi:hypothetical protein
VIELRGEGAERAVKVHYHRWKARWDEWILVGRGRLRMPGMPSPPRPQPDGSPQEEEAAEEEEAEETEEGEGGAELTYASDWLAELDGRTKWKDKDRGELQTMCRARGLEHIKVAEGTSRGSQKQKCVDALLEWKAGQKKAKHMAKRAAPRGGAEEKEATAEPEPMEEEAEEAEKEAAMDEGSAVGASGSAARATHRRPSGAAPKDASGKRKIWDEVKGVWVVRQTWVQCDACNKWRRLPTGCDEPAGEWVCAMHPLPSHALCELDEEVASTADSWEWGDSFQRAAANTALAAALAEGLTLSRTASGEFDHVLHQSASDDNKPWVACLPLDADGTLAAHRLALDGAPMRRLGAHTTVEAALEPDRHRNPHRIPDHIPNP